MATSEEVSMGSSLTQVSMSFHRTTRCNPSTGGYPQGNHPATQLRTTHSAHVPQPEIYARHTPSSNGQEKLEVFLNDFSSHIMLAAEMSKEKSSDGLVKISFIEMS